MYKDSWINGQSYTDKAEETMHRDGLVDCYGVKSKMKWQLKGPLYI